MPPHCKPRKDRKSKMKCFFRLQLLSLIGLAWMTSLVAQEYPDEYEAIVEKATDNLRKFSKAADVHSLSSPEFLHGLEGFPVDQKDAALEALEAFREVTRFVDVNVEIFQGPEGKRYAPPGLADYLEAANSQPSRYLSVVFQISASPILAVNYKTEKLGPENLRVIKEVRYQDRALEWIRAAIDMDLSVSVPRNDSPEDTDCSTTASAAKCEELRISCAERPDLCGQWVQVLELIPNATEAGLEDRLITKFLSTVASLGQHLVPFFPGSAFNDKFTSSASGLGVIFQNLFPPRAVTYQYSSLSGPGSFGWYLKKHEGQPSLLGMHRGIALLEVVPARKVEEATHRLAGLTPKARIVSEWNKDANHNSKFDEIVASRPLKLPARPPKKPEPVTDLSGFPVTLTLKEVAAILQVAEETAKGLLPSIDNGGEVFRRVDLQCYLGEKEVAKFCKDNPPGPDSE